MTYSRCVALYMREIQISIKTQLQINELKYFNYTELGAIHNQTGCIIGYSMILAINKFENHP